MHLYTDRLLLEIGNEPILLTPSQTKVFKGIITKGPGPCPIWDLVEYVWPYTLGGEQPDRLLRSHILNIKKRMGKWAPWLVTVHGWGYKTKIYATWS